ncbi:MAG: NUDIX domain-containing protein [Egibacteraceae bacterium]
MTPVPPARPNPWLTRASRVTYDNAWIRVREDAVVRPDGAPGIYGVVEFKNRALGVVPVFDDGATVLVGQHRYPHDAWSWEIPSGGGRFDHPAEEEIRRELREETGLSAHTWTPLGQLHTSNSVTDEVGELWLAEHLVQEEADPEPTEELSLWRLPLSEAVRMALEGELIDGVTVVGLCRAAHYRAVRDDDR